METTASVSAAAVRLREDRSGRQSGPGHQSGDAGAN
jgi:hypothetical protein